MQDYPIDQISWHTETSRRKAVRESAYAHIRTIVEFLQSNGLLNRPLIRAGQQLSDSFGFRKSDLTDEGFEFVRRCYDRWLGAIDRGRPPTDVSMLERELKKMRKERSSK